MPAKLEAFSQSYAEARGKFLGAARDAGMALVSYPLDLPGRDGETLAVDAAWQGPRDATRLLMLSSGCHGAEGYCGSGAQVALLRDAAWCDRVLRSGVAVLYVHALNPYGFSHTRRVTQENVDLNRNFLPSDRALPRNPAYVELHPLLLPPTWPPTLANRAAIAWLIVSRGLRNLQTAISGGQYERADGLFFGGTEPTWSHRTLLRLLREHMVGVLQLAWIDLHTGLGRSGRCERMHMGRPDDTAGYARANGWWGGSTPLTRVGSKASVSADLSGLIWNAALRECPQAEMTGIYMEFGTRPLLEVLHALRGAHWLQLHPEAPAEQAAAIKRRLRDAFYEDTPRWKQAVLAEVRQAAGQAIDGLAP
jgi:hypothetical protein